MRILVAGQKTFGRDVAVMVEEQGHSLAAVSCPMDIKDRLFVWAANTGTKIIPSGTLKAEAMPDGVDLIIAAHSWDFLGRATRARARLGAIGYHPSLLPRHRGRDAVRWAIKMGDAVTGGTVYWLTDTVDGGPVAAQDFCFILPGEAPRTLWERELRPMGVRLLVKVLADLAAKRMVQIDQDPAFITWEPAMAGQPRLFRPDLPLLGNNGFEIIKQKDWPGSGASVQ